jgi:hypothetical protein
MALVTDFWPYFYVAQPRAFTEDDIEGFIMAMNVSLIV